MMTRGWRWRGAVVGVVLVFLGGLEVGVRAIESRLPAPLEWHSFEAQRKVGQMDELAERGVDVVFLGTSMTNSGIIPSLFVSSAGEGINAYNAALSSGRPELMETWALHVVLPRLHPRVVVIGLTSGDLNDNVGGDRPFLDSFENSRGGVRALGRETLVDKTDRWLTDHVALWRDRTELRDPATVWDALRGADPSEDPVAASIDGQGHVTFRGNDPFTPRPAEQGISGVTNWSLGTRQPNALRRLIADSQASGAKVVLVQLPITEDYIDRHPNKQTDYDTGTSAIRDLARDAGAGLIVLDGIRDHQFFSDEVHLNHSGAVKFTVALADAMRAAGDIPSS